MPRYLLSKGPIRLAPGDAIDLRLALLKTEDAISEHDRGRLYFALEEYEKALAFFSRSYKSNKTFFGDAHERTLKSLNDLAAAQMELQKYDEAYENFLQAFSGLKSKLGLRDDSTICAQCNLALSCYYTKKSRLGNQTVNDIMRTRVTLREQKRDISERASSHYSSLLADEETFNQWTSADVTDVTAEPPVPKISREVVQVATNYITRLMVGASPAIKENLLGKNLGEKTTLMRSSSHSPSSRTPRNPGKLGPISASPGMDGSRLEAVKDTNHQRSRSMKASFKFRHGEDLGPVRQKYLKNPNYISQPSSVVHSNSISADDLLAVSPTRDPPLGTSPANKTATAGVVDDDHTQIKPDSENDQANGNGAVNNAVFLVETVEDNKIRLSATDTVEFRDSLPHSFKRWMMVQLQGAGKNYNKDKIIKSSALLDTGSDGCVINVLLVEALGLEVKPADEALVARVTDDRPMTGICGTAEVSVVFKYKNGRQRTIKVNFLVVETCTDDVILSQSFIGQYGLLENNVDTIVSTIAFRKKTKREILEDRVLEEETKRRRAEEAKALEEERAKANELQRREQNQRNSVNASTPQRTPEQRPVSSL